MPNIINHIRSKLQILLLVTTFGGSRKGRGNRKEYMHLTERTRLKGWLGTVSPAPPGLVSQYLPVECPFENAAKDKQA